MKSSPTPAAEGPPDHRGRRILINMGALSGASLWRIGVSFVLQILIARALGLEAIGQYVTVLAFLNVSQVAGELGIPGLLIRDLARRPDYRRAYFRTALVMQVIVAFLIWIVLVLIGRALPLSAEIATSLWLVGASLPLYALTSLCRTLFQAGERMEYVLGVEVFTNSLILLMSLVVLFMNGGVVQLVATLLITQAMSAALSLVLLLRCRLLAAPQVDVHVHLPTFWRQARPFYALALADVFLNRVDILLLNLVTGDYVVGVYSLGYSVVRVVLKLTQSYWQALYPTLSRLLRSDADRYHRLSNLALRYGMIPVLPGAALVFGISAELLFLLFGATSSAAVPVLRLLVWTAPAFVFEAYAVVQLMIVGRPRDSMAVTVLHIIATALVLPPMALYYGASGAAAAMLSAAILGAGAGLLFLVRNGIQYRIPRLGVMIFGAILAGVATAAVPGGWIIQISAGAALCTVVFWVGGVVSATDVHLLRSALRSDGG